MQIPWKNTVNTFMHLFHLNPKNCQTQILDCNMGIQMFHCDTSGRVHVQLPQKVITFLLQTFQTQSPEEINSLRNTKFSCYPQKSQSLKQCRC